MTLFYRPTPNSSLKSAALSLWAAGLVIPTGHENTAWTFAGQSVTETGVSGAVGTSVSGYAAAVAGAAGEAWLLQDSGALVQMTSGGAFTAYALPSGSTYRGLAYISQPYVIDAYGQIRTTSGSGTAAVVPVIGRPITLDLVTSGTTLFTMSPTTSEFAFLHVSGPSAGVSGAIATPMTTPSCIAASTAASAVAVGGWDSEVLASGFVSMAISPSNYSVLAGITPGTSILSVWGNFQSTWSFSSAVTGLAAANFVAWQPDGLGVFTCDPVNDDVQVFSYSLGLLTPEQTLNITGASAIGVLDDSEHALVLQQSQSLVTPIAYNGATWIPQSAFAIATPSSIIMTSASGAIIGCASGLAALSMDVSGVWTVTATGSIGINPTYLAASDDYLYAAVAGTLKVTSGLAVAYSGTWTGGISGLAVVQEQAIIADPTVGLRMFGLNSVAYTQQNLVLAPAGLQSLTAGGLVFGFQDFFASGSSETWQYNLTGPYQLDRSRAGKVSIYNTGVWASVDVGTNILPETLTFNPSGAISVAMSNNTLYTISTSAVVTSSGVIAQAVGQPATTPLGISRLVWLSGKLYASTILNDSLIGIE